jgi:hypothetical protein
MEAQALTFMLIMWGTIAVSVVVCLKAVLKNN